VGQVARQARSLRQAGQYRNSPILSMLRRCHTVRVTTLRCLSGALYKRRMKKKMAGRKRRLQLQCNCTEADLENFTRAAKRDGHTDRTAWVMFNLRRIARESLKGDYSEPHEPYRYCRAR
jgi:hypothetical protein